MQKHERVQQANARFADGRRVLDRLQPIENVLGRGQQIVRNIDGHAAGLNPGDEIGRRVERQGEIVLRQHGAVDRQAALVERIDRRADGDQQQDGDDHGETFEALALGGLFGAQPFRLAPPLLLEPGVLGVLRRFDERDRLGVERFATLGENLDRLGERAPARQQEFGATAFLAPLRLGRLDPRPRAQELAVGFDQRGGARPAGDERLMGQADPRPVGDQQPRRDERLEQTGARLRLDEPFAPADAAARGFQSRPGHHLPEQRRQFALGARLERAERRFGAPFDRSFEAAESIVGGDGQRALGAVTIVEQFVERELQQRQGAGLARRGDELVVEADAGRRAPLVTKARRLGRRPDDLLDLRRTRRREIERKALALQRDEFGHRLELGVEVAAHRRCDPHAAGANERRQRRRERFDAVARELEDFLELIDDQQQPNLRRPIEPLRPLQRRGDALQGLTDRVGGGERRGPRESREVRRRRVVARREFGQSLGAVERVSQAEKEIAARFGRPDRSAPPGVDAGDRPGLAKARREARPHERRLARAAHAEHQQERPLRLAQPLAQLLDDAAPAEEHRGVFLVERLKAAKRRAQPFDRPNHRRCAEDAAALQPLAQVLLDQRLEFVGRGEIVVAGDEMPGFADEPLLPETVEREPLRSLLVEPLGAQQHLGRLAVGQHVGSAALARGLHRVLEFEFRARRRRAVVAAIGLRQRRAEALPQDAQDDVGLRRRDDLRLEVLVGGIVRGLPSDDRQLCGLADFAAKACDDALHPLPLGADVRGRGNEDAIFLARLHSPRPRSANPRSPCLGLGRRRAAERLCPPDAR